MARRAGTFRAAGFVVALACAAGLPGCGGGGSGPAIACSQAGGVWDVALDYGNGLVGHQSWTIAQDGCTLTLTGDPPDQYGPSLGGGAVIGNAGAGSLWASWTNTWDSCRFYSSLDAILTGDTLSGTINWTRNSFGAGYCPSASGQVAVIGSR